MESKLSFIFKAVSAGMFIGIGAIAYMSMPGIIGAILFCVGLLLCLQNKAELFTGKVGYASLPAYQFILVMLCMLLLNGVGIILMTLFKLSMTSTAGLITTGISIIETRLATSFWGLLAGSIGCGMLMSAAVDLAGRNIAPYLRPVDCIPVLLCVPVFIICGFPHCVADLAYYTVYVTNTTTPDIIRLISMWTVCVVGNTIGCTLTGRLNRKFINCKTTTSK